MNIVINQSLILNFVIAFVALLFMVLISIQLTLNKILKEIREIRVLKSKSEHKLVRREKDD